MSEIKMDLASITGSAKGLVKGVAIVDLLATRRTPMRQADIASEVGLPHATAVRLLDVLVGLDLLGTTDTGKYVLGSRLAGWGQAFLDSVDVAMLGTDLVEALVAETNETSFLGVRDKQSVLYVSAVSSPQPIRPVARIGSRNPLHCTGIGKCLLAFADEAARDDMLAGDLERRTTNTITDRAALDEELRLTKERGYAIDEIENEDGVRCVAAPVHDHRGRVVAAISVSAPAYRFTTDDVARYAPSVMNAADELSRRIGLHTSTNQAATTAEGIQA